MENQSKKFHALRRLKSLIPNAPSHFPRFSEFGIEIFTDVECYPVQRSNLHTNVPFKQEKRRFDDIQSKFCRF